MPQPATPASWTNATLPAALLLVACLAAGCASQASISSPVIPIDAKQPESWNLTTPTPAETARPGAFDIGDCHGLVAAQHWPGPSPPTPTPDNWSTAGNGFPPSVYYEHWDCARVKFGGFERSADFLLESHDFIQPPEACTRGRPGIHLAILRTIWVNDTDLLDAMVQAGWPAKPIAIHVNASVAEVDTRFEVAGHTAGELRILSAALPVRPVANNVMYLWQDGTGIGRADSAYSYSTPVESAVAIGELHSPFLWPEAGHDQFAGRSQAIEAGVATWSYQHFGDTSCTVAS